MLTEWACTTLRKHAACVSFSPEYILVSLSTQLTPFGVHRTAVNYIPSYALHFYSVPVSICLRRLLQGDRLFHFQLLYSVRTQASERENFTDFTLQAPTLLLVEQVHIRAECSAR